VSKEGASATQETAAVVPPSAPPAPEEPDFLPESEDAPDDSAIG
jgi:hypothetical protein